RDEQYAIAVEGDAFRKIQMRAGGCRAIATESSAARKASGARHGRDPAIEADLANPVVSGIGEINIAGGIDDGRTWHKEQCTGCRSAIKAASADTGTGYGCDCSGRQPAQPIRAGIANDQTALAIQRDTFRVVQEGVHCRGSIGYRPISVIAQNRVDDAIAVDPPDTGIVNIRNRHVARRVYRNRDRIHGSPQCRTSIPRATKYPGPRNRVDVAVSRNPADATVVEVAY